MRFSLKQLLSDFSASVVVYLVALPLCLGVALASGTLPIAGMVAGIIGGIVVGLISKSPLSVSGPAAGLTAIVAGALADLPSYHAFLLSVLIAGVIQILFGFLRAGQVAAYIPVSVIKGMLAAIGMILILKQIPFFFGFANLYHSGIITSASSEKKFYTEPVQAMMHPDKGALLIGMVSLLILLIFESKPLRVNSFFRFLPPPLLVVVSGVLINSYLDFSYSEWSLSEGQLVLIPVFESPQLLVSSLAFPDFHAWANWKTWSVAIIIAIIGSLESLLSIEAIDKLDPQKRITPPNHELKAQGAGNILSALFGGLPVTSVIVRSSANVYAGGASKYSTIFHGLLLLFSLLFIPRWLNLIPLTSLAAILIVTGYKLTQPKLFLDMKKKGPDQFIPFLVTIVAILQTDLLKGVFVGLFAALVFYVVQIFNSSVRIMKDDHRMVIKFGKDVSFLNKGIIRRNLLSVKENMRLYIDATNSEYIDREIVEVVNEFIRHAAENGIHLYIRRCDSKKQRYFTGFMNLTD
jgi:MFS superfamily sulfate permease-like transporter